MRIVIDIRHLTRTEQSGVGEYTNHLLAALFAVDATNDYVLFSSGRPSSWSVVPRFSAPNVSHIHVPVSNRLLNATMLSLHRPRFENLVFGPKAQVNKQQTVFFFPNLNIVSINPLSPYVLTLHDLSFETFPHFYSRKSRLWHRLVAPRAFAQGAAAVITPSRATAQDVANVYDINPKRVHVVPHGIGKQWTANAQPEDHGVRSKYHLPNRFALFIGTLEPRKNIAMMMKAVCEYRTATGDDLTLVLAGKQTDYSKRVLASLPPEHKKRTICLGYLEAKDRPSLYRLAKVTLFPSIYEGFGLPILESMASGTPVITSVTSSMPEVGAQAAIYIDPYNRTDLVVALKQLLSSPTYSHILAERGLARATHFSWDICAAETLKVLEQSIHSP